MQTSSTPIVALYTQAAPGVPVRLFDGDLTIGGASGAGKVELRLDRGLNVRWEADANVFAHVGNEVDIEFDHPQFGPVSAKALVLNSDGRGSIQQAYLGNTAESLTSAIVHWVNVPDLIPREAIAANGSTWAGRWRVSGGGWNVVLDAPPDLHQVFNAAKETGESAMTHVMHLERTDGATFTVGDLETAAHSLQWALSFAVGHWVAPAVIAGFDGSVRVYEQWGARRCDRPQAPRSWWVRSRIEDLTEFVGLFLDAFHDPARSDRVRYYAHHVVEARTDMVLEARVLLLGAANEYLSWVRHVVNGTRKGKVQKETRAVDLLRELLTEAAIDPSNPAELAAITALISKVGKGAGVSDGPGAITWIRNRVAHPKNASEPYAIKFLLHECWLLLQQYSELILLNEVGYGGQFQPHYPRGRFAATGEPVPWNP